MTKRTVMHMKIQQIEFSDDSMRKSKPCLKCKKPTTGRVAREARCLDCTMSYALSPLAGLANLLKRNAGE